MLYWCGRSDRLTVVHQALCDFATDPTTIFLLEYDDIKHAHVPMGIIHHHK
jgi:hypothetical protein